MAELLQLNSSEASVGAAGGNPVRPCLVCGAGGLEEFLNLGRTPLANQFLTISQLNQLEPSYPLRVGFCAGCSHVQLLDLVAPPEMFEHYLYISSASATLERHLQSLAETVCSRYRLTSSDLVVDVGSNDGTLLAAFARRQVKTLGVDPARNLADLARAKGVVTETAFFGAATAGRLRRQHGEAAIITATNSFPHIPDLDDYLEGVNQLLAPDGALVIEAHYLMDLLEQCAFDTIYHEHVSYWALGPARFLLERHNLEVVDVERLPLHHGQIRLWIQRRGVSAVRASLERLGHQESVCGLDRLETYQRFAGRVGQLKSDLLRLLKKLRQEGKTLAAYGAPAKGMTLLSFLGLGPDTIHYIADRSPLKQGRFTPGSHIPIVTPERLLRERPDYVLLLAWNFAEEIQQQLSGYREQGGHFIVPVPEVQIV